MNTQTRIAERVERMARVGSRETAAWVEAAQRRGTDILELLGGPLTLPGDNVIEAAANAARDYCKAPSHGLLELRKAIARKVEREQHFTADPDTEILVTAGAMQGLNAILLSLLDPGDHVLVTRPGFFFYGIAELAHGRCAYVSTYEGEGFGYDIERFEDAITPETKALILVNPNNPTGHLATRAELDAIAALAEKHDLLVISDDSYERMVYDGAMHVSFASRPGVKERTITVQSFTKSYAMVGWRVGYVIGPEPLIAHFRKVHEWMVLCCGYIEQKAAAAAMDGPQEWVEAIRTHFQACRDAMCDELRGIPFVRPIGGPYLFLNVAQFGHESRRFSRRLIEEFGVPNEPGEVFGSAGYIRVPFGAKRIETARQGGVRVREALGV